MLLSQYLEKWLPAHCVGLRPATVSSYADTVKIIIKQAETTEINLSPLDVPLIYAPQISAGHIRTAQLMYTILKMALKDAEEMGLIVKNPLKKLKKPKKPSKKIKSLTVEQGKKLLNIKSWYIIVWALALLAGLRRGEIAALRWFHIQETKLTVEATRSYVNGRCIEGPPKTDAGNRILPVSAILWAYVCSAKLAQRAHCLAHGVKWSEESYVITRDGRPINNPKILNENLKKDLAAAGLPRISCHGLRHSFAIAAVRAGIQMRVLQALMGHENIQTTAKYYAEVPEETMEEATNAISARYA